VQDLHVLLLPHLCKLKACEIPQHPVWAWVLILQEYKASIRNLVANLRRNEELRQSVLSNALSPYDLVRKSPKELATEQHRLVQAYPGLRHA